MYETLLTKAEYLVAEDMGSFFRVDKYTKECNFVFHLDGVNKPKNVFYTRRKR